MSKHLSIFGDFHRIITSSNVCVSHSSAGVAHRSVICLPNDSSCWNVVLMVLAQPSTEFCIRDPYSGSHFSLNSRHLTLGPLHWTPLCTLRTLHSYHAGCLALVLGISLNHPRRLDHDSSRASVLSFHLQLNTWAVQVLEHILLYLPSGKEKGRVLQRWIPPKFIQYFSKCLKTYVFGKIKPRLIS